MHGNYYKNCGSVKPLAPQCPEKLAERPVGVFHGVLTAARLRVFGNAPGRISKRFVIGDGKDRGKKGIAGLGERTALLDRPLIKVFVADSPDGLEGRLGKILLLHESVVTVVEGVGTHPVENTAPAVQENSVITVPLQDAGKGLDVLRTVALHDRIARQRRER